MLDCFPRHVSVSAATCLSCGRCSSPPSTSTAACRCLLFVNRVKGGQSYGHDPWRYMSLDGRPWAQVSSRSLMSMEVSMPMPRARRCFLSSPPLSHPPVAPSLRLAAFSAHITGSSRNTWEGEKHTGRRKADRTRRHKACPPPSDCQTGSIRPLPLQSPAVITLRCVSRPPL